MILDGLLMPEKDDRNNNPVAGGQEGEEETMGYGERSKQDKFIESIARGLCIHLELGKLETYDKCGPVFVVDPIAVAKAKNFLRAKLQKTRLADV